MDVIYLNIFDAFAPNPLWTLCPCPSHAHSEGISAGVLVILGRLSRSVNWPIERTGRRPDAVRQER